MSRSNIILKGKVRALKDKDMQFEIKHFCETHTNLKSNQEGVSLRAQIIKCLLIGCGCPLFCYGSISCTDFKNYDKLTHLTRNCGTCEHYDEECALSPLRFLEWSALRVEFNRLSQKYAEIEYANEILGDEY